MKTRQDREAEDALNRAGLSCFGAIALVLIVPIVLIPLNAWALRTLWAWFMVPEFGVKPLSFLGAYGIAAIVQFVAPKPSGSTKDTGNIWPRLLAVVTVPLFAVAFAWVVCLVAGRPV